MLVIAASGLISMRIALDHLGSEGYGILLLAGTFASWGAIGNFGLSNAIRQRMTSLLALGRVEDAARCLSSGIMTLGCIGVALLAGFLVLHESGATRALIGGEVSDVPRAARVLLIGVLLFLLKFPFNPLGVVILSRNQVVAHNIFTMIHAATHPLVIWVTLRQTRSLEALLLVQSAHQWLDLCLRYGLVLRQVPGLRIRPSFASFRTAGTLLSPSLAFLVISVGMIVIYRTDNAVIGGIVGVQFIPGYAAAFRIFGILREICIAGVEVLFPAAAILDSTGERERLREYVIIGCRFALALSVLGGAGLAALGGPLIAVWLGDELAHPPSPATLLALGALLPVGVFVNAVNRPVSGVGRHGRQALIFILEMVANLGLSIWLAHSLGVLGVALGTLCARTIVTPLYFLDSVRALGFDPLALIRRALLPSLLLAAPLVAVGWLRPLPPDLGGKELLAIIAGYAGFCVLAMALITPAAIRAKVLARMRRRKRG